MLDRVTYTTLLYDFYGSLLTKRQNEIMDMYFMQDLSLSEISGLLGISRQAASMLINRTEKILTKYEDRLSLIEKHTKRIEKGKEIIESLEDIQNNQEINVQKIINQINYLLLE